MLEEVTKIQIEPYGDTVPGVPGVLEQVRIQFNDDFGQFFYLRNNASTALLLERIVRMCLSALVDGHPDLIWGSPYKKTDKKKVEAERRRKLVHQFCLQGRPSWTMETNRLPPRAGCNTALRPAP